MEALNFGNIGRSPHSFTHGRHWQMARYELPVEEVERKLANGRYVVDVVVGDEEKLAYVHKYTGKRVEFTRPRLDSGAALEEADAKWQCELAFAEANARPRESNILGVIKLPRSTNDIVADWKQHAKDPTWVKWPTTLGKVQTAGAFGRVTP